MYFSLIPGAQVWIEGLLTNPVDMQTREGFMAEQSMVAPTLHRIPLTGGPAEPVVENIIAAIPQPAAQ